MEIKIEQIEADLSSVRPERVASMKESLADVGLLHPIIVTENDSGYKLVAGKVRLKAFIELGEEIISANIVTAEDANRILEVSLQENLRRSNLEWYEIIELEEELHNLRIAQHGKRRTGRGAASAPGWSQQDTAEELKIAIGGVYSRLLFLLSRVAEIRIRSSRISDDLAEI